MRFLQIMIWLALCVATNTFADTPSDLYVVYDVLKDTIKVGQIEEVYTRDKDHYTLSSTLTPVGLLALFKPDKIVITSHGLADVYGLKPLSFNDQREHDESRTSHADFAWDTAQLVLANQGQRTVLPLPKGTQDRLSVMYQFMFLPVQKVSQISFPMTNGKKLDDYQYSVSIPQKIKTPAGEFDVVYLDNHAKPGEHRSEIWLATQYYNLPCKMTITDGKGDQLTQVLTKLQIKP